MNKPFSIIYEDFKKNLTVLINNSGLPLPVVESVLQNYLNEVNNYVKNQYIADKTRYEKSMTEEKNEESEEIKD